MSAFRRRWYVVKYVSKRSAGLPEKHDPFLDAPLHFARSTSRPCSSSEVLVCVCCLRTYLAPYACTCETKPLEEETYCWGARSFVKTAAEAVAASEAATAAEAAAATEAAAAAGDPGSGTL